MLLGSARATLTGSADGQIACGKKYQQKLNYKIRSLWLYAKYFNRDQLHLEITEES